ncbi:hypothetical protein D3C87_1510420 [compost metagenome]
MGPEGFHTFSQIRLKEVAKVMIKKEFNIGNQDTVTSELIELNSRYNFQPQRTQMIKKDIPEQITIRGYLNQIFFANANKTADTTTIGKTVKAASTHLNRTAVGPSRIRCV